MTFKTKHLFVLTTGLIALAFIIAIRANLAYAAPPTAPQDYSYTFNYTNLYADYTLRYEFSGLDTDTQYTFILELLDRTTGGVTSTLSPVHIVGPGVATATFEHWPWPLDKLAPFRVKDQYDQILGYHFLSPIPDTDWDGDGQADEGDRTAIGLLPFSGAVLNGIKHVPTQPSLVTTRENDISVLHYQIPTSSTDYEDQYISLGSTFDGASIATFSYDELVDYNRPDSCVCTETIDGEWYREFVVINTSGNRPFYINLEQEQEAFDGVVDIPHYLEVDPGGYDYSKVESNGDLVALGDGVWVVSESNQDFTDWKIALLSNSVPVGGKQKAFLSSQSELVWLSFIEQYLTDTTLPSNPDLADGILYNEFQSEHEITWDVGGTTSAFDLGTQSVVWSITPTTMRYATDTRDNYTFLIFKNYQLVETPSYQDRALQFLARYNLASGWAILLIAAVGLLLFFTIFKEHKLPSQAYALLFILTAFTLVMTDWFSAGIDGLMIAMALLSTPLVLRRNDG